MADDRNDAPRPSWRRKEKESETTRPSAGKKYEWSSRKLKPVTVKSSSSPQILKRMAAGIGLLTCIAAIASLIFMLWPATPVGLILVGADYADNLTVPHNILGWKGLEALRSLGQTPPPSSLIKPARIELIGDIRKVDLPEDWDKLIRDLEKTRFRHKTIVLVLSLHGGSDSRSAYLYPGRMARPQDRLELKTVIQDMGRLPADREKILIIEAAQVTSSWQLGVLHNDFARRLNDLEEEIRKIPRLRILSAAGEDQRCWASEGLERTVFLHYLVEALRGRATASGERLNLQGLHRFVRDHVRDWVWHERRALQEPVLLPQEGGASRATGGQKSKSSSSQQNGNSTVALTPANEITLPVVPHAEDLRPKDQRPDFDEVRSAWKDFQELDGHVPHPSVTSPRRWRTYRAQLVRLDELVRAAASDQDVSVMRERVRATHDELQNERVLGTALTSIENNLVMNTLEGKAGEEKTSEPKEKASEFVPFWSAVREAEAAAIWKSRLDSDAGRDRGRPSLRIRADDFLIEQAIKEPGKDLELASQRLQLTVGNDSQPAEAHFLRMLALRLKPVGNLHPRRLTLIGKAIGLKKVAERAALSVSAMATDYSYGEQLYPWIRESLKAADSLRRLAEDRIFADDEAAWEEAAADQAKASGQFQNIARRARAVRLALQARDRALAILPEFSHWAADRGSVDSQGDLLLDIEKLWEKTHRLTAQLELGPGDSKQAQSPVDFERLGGEVAQGLTRLSDQFIELNRPKADWEKASAAAAVSNAIVSDRDVVWKRIIDLQRSDREAIDQRQGATRLTDADMSRIQREVRARAEAQGRMALAALGQGWFQDPDFFPGKDEADHAAVLARVHVAGELDSDHSQTWWQGVAWAGDLVGERWQRMAEAIDTLADEQQGISNFDEFRDRKLTKADRLERFVAAGAISPGGSTSRAAIRLREARIHDLLLGLADRTWEDHWYDENGKDKYFQKAGSRFIGDASKFFPRSQRVADAKVRMDRKGSMTVVVDPGLTVTSETNVKFAYRVPDQDSVPEGFPVVRPIVQQPLTLASEDGGFHAVPREEVARPHFVKIVNPLGLRFEKDLTENQPRIVQSLFNLEGFFRGQNFKGETLASLHPVPDIVAIGPPPNDPREARVAVRASKELIDRFGSGNGTIAIVLDCSGSMNAPTQEHGPSKFQAALSALRQILKKVPDKTRLSLWTFSLGPPGTRLLPNGNIDPSSAPGLHAMSEEPETTISSSFLPMGPWEPRRTDQVVDQISSLLPCFGTPLAEAMWRAASNDLADAEGLKTLLVLTDGDDSELNKNKPQYNPRNQTVKDFIVSRLNPLNVTVNMVFFTSKDNPEEIEKAKEAKKNFGPALDQLEPRGSFKTADNLDDLIAMLQRGLKQELTCQILKPNNTSAGGDPLVVTSQEAAEDWSKKPLEPGPYKLRVIAGAKWEDDIELAEGDRLIVDLEEGPNATIVFRRGLYSDSIEFAGRKHVGQNWRMTVLTNQNLQSGSQSGLQMAAALESQPAAKRFGPIHQVHPIVTWFRIGPEGRFMSIWRPRNFFPGPVWQMNVPRWIADPAGDGIARPILDAWWSTSEDPPARAIEFAFDSPGNPRALPHVLKLGDKNSVRIESIEFEDHLVEVEPGNAMSKRCLVVRLDCGAGNRFVVDPASFKDVGIVGYEHRLYSQARKYTGLFWPVTQSTYQRLIGLSLIDLDQFIQQAEKRGNSLQMKLEQPAVDSRLPPPS